MTTLIILGSARDDGNTLKVVREFLPTADYELVDLRARKISQYNYESAQPADDEFLAIAERMSRANHIVFATPVYWYSMSASLKNFVDRLSDLLSVHKSLRRALKGETTSLISSGYDVALPPGFEEPFRLTSEYFGMRYEAARYKSVRSPSPLVPKNVRAHLT